MIVLTRTTRIDWPRIVANLQRCGMTITDIAGQAQVPRKTLAHYCDESLQAEPPFWIGSRLLVLWAARVGLPYTDAPVRVVTPSVSQVLRETA